MKSAMALAMCLSVVLAPASANAAEPVVLVGAGDIATCSNSHDSDTAALIQPIISSDPTAIAFTAGDNVYPDGSLTHFNNCYQPSWGVFKSRTRPVPGNHDYYRNPGAQGYFDYFGNRAGKAGRGFYRYFAGTWRVYALTSECAQTTRCFKRQLSWLRADLDANPQECVIAIWHRPRFSSSIAHGSSTRMAPVFELLYEHGAELVISGHDHTYERFAPTDPSGSVDHSNGVRQFVVGTGGASHYGFDDTPLPASEVRNGDSYGVLRLTLSPGAYSWEFLPAAGDSFSDSGAASCH